MTIPEINGRENSNLHLNATVKNYPENNANVENINNELQQQNVQHNQSETEEKEYSIGQFRRDYSTIFNTKVLPELEQFEGERKTRLTWAIIASICCILLGIGVLIFAIQADVNVKGLHWYIMGCAWLAWSAIKKPFEKKIKKKIMPSLMKAFPGFYWQETPPIQDNDMYKALIFNLPKNLKAVFDDCFVGKYREVTVHVAECEYTINRGNNTKETAFEGAMIRIKMNKHFDGITVIRPKKNAPRKDNYKDLQKAGLQEVKLEDSEFEKLYTVYSTDQIEARYLITTAFMERLKSIQKAFAAQCCFCSFSENYIYLGMHTGCDLFALGSLKRPVIGPGQYSVLLSEFVSVLELVDHFKLEQKLGL